MGNVFHRKRRKDHRDRRHKIRADDCVFISCSDKGTIWRYTFKDGVVLEVLEYHPIGNNPPEIELHGDYEHFMVTDCEGVDGSSVDLVKFNKYKEAIINWHGRIFRESPPAPCDVNPKIGYWM